MARKGKVKKGKTVEELGRPFRPRRYDLFMLIVCEDQKTEPYYFRKIKALFPEETVYIREIGTGKKPKAIVEQSIKEREKLSLEAKKSIDEVWVVFDKDDEGNNETTLASFTFAWEQAESESIKIAFSNEVFELWLLLHFKEVTPSVALPRKVIYKELSETVRNFADYQDFEYQHGNTSIIDAVFQIGKEDMAISRAEALAKAQEHKKPIDANPSTGMYLLVKRLRELIDWYSTPL